MSDETIFPIPIGCFSIPHGSTGRVLLTEGEWATLTDVVLGYGSGSAAWVRSWETTDNVELPAVCRVYVYVEMPTPEPRWLKFSLLYVIHPDEIEWQLESWSDCAPLPQFDPDDFPLRDHSLRYAEKSVNLSYYGSVQIPIPKEPPTGEAD